MQDLVHLQCFIPCFQILNRYNASEILVEVLMSILDIFRKKKLPEGDPHAQKAGLKLINKNTETGTRYAAAETLADIGTDEAIYCLLQRFTVVIGTAIPDEDEKKFVYKKIRSFGKAAIDPIIKFLQNKEHPAQALELLREITSEEEYINKLLELIETFDPYFSKYPEKKIQTFKILQSSRDERLIDALKNFLDDDDDDVQIAALKALAAQGNEEKTREILLELILEAEERPRVRLAACESMVELGWKVKGYRKQINNVLPDRFYIDSKGHIKLKGNVPTL